MRRAWLERQLVMIAAVSATCAVLHKLVSPGFAVYDAIYWQWVTLFVVWIVLKDKTQN